MHYFNIKTSERALNELKEFLNKKCGAKLRVYTIDGKYFKNLPVDRIPYEAYSRLIAQFILPQDMDRVLWLDGDIIVLKDVS